MPSELRHILFRPAEVVQAIKEYRRRTGEALPPGSITSCRPETDGPGGPVRFRMTMVRDEPNGGGVACEPEEIVVAGAALAAALMMACRDRRIPLPMRADKSLQLFGEQLCLVAAINARPDGNQRSARSKQ